MSTEFVVVDDFLETYEGKEDGEGQYCLVRPLSSPLLALSQLRVTTLNGFEERSELSRIQKCAAVWSQ